MLLTCSLIRSFSTSRLDWQELIIPHIDTEMIKLISFFILYVNYHDSIGSIILNKKCGVNCYLREGSGKPVERQTKPHTRWQDTTILHIKLSVDCLSLSTWNLPDLLRKIEQNTSFKYVLIQWMIHKGRKYSETLTLRGVIIFRQQNYISLAPNHCRSFQKYYLWIKMSHLLTFGRCC